MMELKKAELICRVPTEWDLMMEKDPVIGMVMHDWNEERDGDWIEIYWLDGEFTVEDGWYMLQKLEEYGTVCRA